MSFVAIIAGGAALVGWIALAVALLDRSRLYRRIGELEVSIERGSAMAQAARADAAERQVTAARAGQEEAERELDTTIATIGDGVMAPDLWDRHAGDGSGVSPPGDSTGDGAGPVSVPDR